MTLGAVRQHLEPRGIRVARCEPDADGNCQFKAWVGKQSVKAGDPEELYVKALRRLT